MITITRLSSIAIAWKCEIIEMVTRHIVKEVEELLKDIPADCFVYGSNEVVTEENDADGANNNEITTNRTHKCDGSCSSANLSGTNGLTAVTRFLPLEKAKSIVWNYFGFPVQSGNVIQKDKHFQKEVYSKLCKKSLSYIIQGYHNKHDCTASESSLSSV